MRGAFKIKKLLQSLNRAKKLIQAQLIYKSTLNFNFENIHIIKVLYKLFGVGKQLCKMAFLLLIVYSHSSLTYIFDEYNLRIGNISEMMASKSS